VKSLHSWVNTRAGRHGLDGHVSISSQRRIALWLTVFAAVRTAAWLVCMSFIAAHWMGASGIFIHSFISLSGSVVFVSFISFYCNASTDAANLMAGIAALFSADSHHDSEATRAALGIDFRALESDVLRLALLQPGDEAEALAAEIHAKLATVM
jgi:hypothetical protein